ncbi:hypothetical protein QBC39DRAFT_360139 [Podospora conica]|nr:hypothetical protein QBC39DRAFT_360139 [Schizothecium conicum]
MDPLLQICPRRLDPTSFNHSLPQVASPHHQNQFGFIEMATDISLLALPVEILCDIITLVDPITLINLSQTCRRFRDIIQPSHDDFVQRLLALEMTPEHGGIIPLFRSRDNHIEPPFEHPDWDRNKYACSGCLKLRSHKCFDNHSILRLKTRKPPPGSSETCKLTDWVPLDLSTPGAQWRRRQKLAAEEATRLAPFQQKYRWYCAGLYSPPWNLHPDNLEDIDAQGAAAEKMVCGLARHTRVCIECRRLRGDFTNQTGQAPTIASRTLCLPSDLTMHFPGLFDGILLSQRPGVFRYFHIERTKEICFARIVHCRFCGSWYNVAAFRVYTDRGWTLKDRDDRGWILKDHDHVGDGVPCNHCMAASSGVEAAAKAATHAALGFLEKKLDEIAYRLMYGWFQLRDDFYEPDGLLRDHKAWADENLAGLGWAKKSSSGGCDISMFKLKYYLEVHSEYDLTKCHHRLRDFVAKIVDQATWEATWDKMDENWFHCWWKDYFLNSTELSMIQNTRARMKANPLWLGDYVLERAPYLVLRGNRPGTTSSGGLRG